MAPSLANSADFVRGLWPLAEARGRQPVGVRSGLSPAISYLPKVMELTSKQPEFSQTVQQYIDRRVTAAQAQKGQAMRAEWNQTLTGSQQRWGVQPEFVLAIWGMETNFGGFMGGENTIHALATLTEGGYRPDFFREELLTALRIVSDGHVSAGNMTGSWAGAMGHTQFMPSSFMRYAVDYNGDGRKDIWNSVQDALGSTANYLNKLRLAAGRDLGLRGQAAQRLRLRRGAADGAGAAEPVAGHGHPARVGQAVSATQRYRRGSTCRRAPAGRPSCCCPTSM